MASRTIVVVEDNIDFAAILQTILDVWGYLVQHYETVAGGLAAVTRSTPAMLILDGQLPDGDGFELYRRLRRIPATQTLPILLLSVSDDVYQQARAASTHDPYLYVGLKPIPLEEIQTVVERMIGA